MYIYMYVYFNKHIHVYITECKCETRHHFCKLLYFSSLSTRKSHMYIRRKVHSRERVTRIYVKRDIYYINLQYRVSKKTHRMP